jgi:hypothetical protein
VLVVVVVPPIRKHASHPEEAHKRVETRNAGRALRRRELMGHLEAGSVADSIRTATLATKAD